MTESRLYLNFFKKNFLLIIVPFLMGVFLGLVIFLSQPVNYKITGTLKVINTGSLVDSSLVTDQVVGNLRAVSSQLINSSVVSLEIYKQSFTVYKSGPDTLVVEMSGADQSEKSMEEFFEYAENNFSVSQLGEFKLGQFDRSLFLLLIPVVMGLTLGIILALIKSYFKNY